MGSDRCEALPALIVNPGTVTISRPLPNGSVLTPSQAVEYAASLLQAAAQAEGARLLKRAAALRQHIL
jgi:hypothetical protein